MKLTDISISNLRRRKAKALFILIGLLIGVTSVVTFLSLVDALSRDINHKMEKYGANIMIMPKTENLSLTYGGMAISGVAFEIKELLQKDLLNIRSIKNAANVAAVGPMTLGSSNIKNKNVLLAGVDFDVAGILRPWWRINGKIPEKDSLLLGSEAAEILNLKIGENVDINERQFNVSGILYPTGSQDDQIVFTHLSTAQRLLGKEGRISLAEVAALCSACPIDEMVAQISGVMPSAKVMAIKQVVRSRMEALGHFNKFAYGLSILVMLVGGLVVLVTMMGSVRERIPEFGVFMAIGFRKIHVIRIVLFEAVVISAMAGIMGYFLGLTATKFAIPFFTESIGVKIPIDPALAVAVIMASTLLGLLASIYPAIMAGNLDPNEALRTL